MPNDPMLSIIVVSYNTRDLTLACLESVRAETRETDYELIVIDNASGDGSADAIAARFPDIRLIRSTENLGFARANNVAAREARGAYLLLLNPDTVTLRGAIDRIAAFARRRPEAGIWGGRTLFADGSLNPTSCWRDMDLWGLVCRAFGLASVFPGSALFNPEGYGGWLRDDEREVDIVTGCFLLIERGLWERLEGFDLSFVMYAEEADLCLRARALGARPRITPDAEIVHYGGASEKARADKIIRLARAKVTLVNRHWTGLKRVAGRSLFLLWAGLRAALEAAARRLGRRDRAAPVWTDVWRRRAEWIGGYALLPPAPGGKGFEAASAFPAPPMFK